MKALVSPAFGYFVIFGSKYSLIQWSATRRSHVAPASLCCGSCDPDVSWEIVIHESKNGGEGNLTKMKKLLQFSTAHCPLLFTDSEFVKRFWLCPGEVVQPYRKESFQDVCIPAGTCIRLIQDLWRSSPFLCDEAPRSRRMESSSARLRKPEKTHSLEQICLKNLDCRRSHLFVVYSQWIKVLTSQTLQSSRSPCFFRGV